LLPADYTNFIVIIVIELAQTSGFFVANVFKEEATQLACVVPLRFAL